MLKIRLQRTGRTNSPSFRIVVVEHTESTRTGNFVEKLGTYNPRTKERTLNAERAKYWLSVGAKASGTMHNMLISTGIIEGKKVNVLPQKSPPKKEEKEEKEKAEASAPGAEAAAEASSEPPKEEPVSEEKKEEQKEEEKPAEAGDAKTPDSEADKRE